MTAIEEYIGAAVREQAQSTGVLHWNLGEHLNHWSPSSLAALRRCPYQWQQRYIHGRKERPGEAPVTGTAVHAALERNFDQKIQSHEDLPTVELVEWFDDVGFPTTVQLEEAKAGTEISWDTSFDAARSRGRVMLGEYRNQIAPRIQPTGVEEEFSTDEFGLSIPVIGRFDVRRAGSTIDIKTGKSSTSKPKPEWRIQAGIYNAVKDEPVEFHSLTATLKNTVSIVTPLESEEMLVHLSFDQRRLLSQGVRAISAEACLYMELYGPDHPWPTHGVHHSWACNYCGFRPTCPAWQ